MKIFDLIRVTNQYFVLIQAFERYLPVQAVMIWLLLMELGWYKYYNQNLL